MADFVYQAIDAQGKRVKGKVSSKDVSHAEQHLLSLGLTPLHLSKSWLSHLRLSTAVPQHELIAFTHQLAYLLKASVPLLDILHDMQLNSLRDYPHLHSVIDDIQRQISNGKSLSEVLSSYPNIFDEVYIGAVVAGEASGNLSIIFIRLHEQLLWLAQMRQSLRQLLTYPLLVLVVILMVTSILMTQLVPQLLIFLQDSGRPITGVTQALMSTVDWLSHYGAISLMLVILSVMIWRVLLSLSSELALWQDRIKLQVGLFGRIQSYLAVMRMMKVMALLYAAGVPLSQVLDVSKRVSGNLYLSVQIESVIQAVISGKSLAKAFVQTNTFPSMMVQLIQLGEQSGQLEQRLEDIAHHYQHEVDRLVAQIKPWIEPLLTLFLATLLGWILIATIMPIYDVLE